MQTEWRVFGQSIHDAIVEANKTVTTLKMLKTLERYDWNCLVDFKTTKYRNDFDFVRL